MAEPLQALWGMPLASTLGPDQSFTTLEPKIYFPRPVWESNSTAKARIVSRGKAVARIERGVTDAGDRLVARASSTRLILSGETAEGR